MRKWKCVATTNVGLWTVGKIYKTYDNGMGLCADNGDSDGWNSPWELAMAQFEEIKEFTKDDLEPCMVVVLRNGRIGIVINIKDGLAVSFEDGLWLNLAYQSSDMTYDDDEIDIIEVYGFSRYAHDKRATEISTNNRELLYKREEKSEKDLKIEELQARIETENKEHKERMDKLAKDLDELKGE